MLLFISINLHRSQTVKNIYRNITNHPEYYQNNKYSDIAAGGPVYTMIFCHYQLPTFLRSFWITLLVTIITRKSTVAIADAYPIS